MHGHGSELRAKVVHEVLEELEFAKGLALLAELAERGLKVVGLDGNVGGGTGGLRLLKGGQFAVGIFSSLEHVGAVKIDAGT